MVGCWLKLELHVNCGKKTDDLATIYKNVNKSPQYGESHTSRKDHIDFKIWES